MLVKTARQLVVEALCRVEKESAWSHLALDSVLEAAKPPSEDWGFATALFYGSLTCQYTVDACIAAHSKMKIEKMDAIVRGILRTAVYQLRYMDSVPDHAAVNEAVKLTRAMKKSSASGFVNGVLRSFLRSGKVLPPPEKDSLTEHLALEYSCPPPLVQLWLDAYGEEDTRTILAQSLLAPPTFLRVNTSLISTEELLEILKESGVVGQIDPQLPDCIRLESQGALHKLDAYEEGWFHLQDLSSQRVAFSLGALAGERVLDLCAAPGGKSFVLAQLVGKTGEVVACDLHQHRINELENRRQRLSLGNITTHVLDMTEHHPELGTFDRVLCDAPCSGYGTIRRRPEIKAQPPWDFKTLPALQVALLSAAGKYCKKGGILVYSTCTLSPKENQLVVEKFLVNHPEFTLEVAKQSPFSQPMETILLGEAGGDGFFVASFRR